MTENERLLLDCLRSGITFEEVFESHEACCLIAAVCEENKRHGGFEVIRKRVEADNAG